MIPLLLALVSATSVLAAVSLGGACLKSHDRIDARSGRFLSDCDDTTFCSGAFNGTCQPRVCRRDEFSFGFENATDAPSLCASGKFCPDEGGGCLPLLDVGQPCQMDRDEQCAPAQNWQDLASDRNVNGSLCLHSMCTYANMTLGQPCILDVTTYSDGGAYNNTITRHNCQTPQFYCDVDLHACVPTKARGLPCDSDQECVSFNCDFRGVCSDRAGTPASVETWQVAMTGLSVVATMAAVVIMLTLVHRRLRLQRCREIREYYEEQLSLRGSLVALHAAVADRYRGEKSGIRCD